MSSESLKRTPHLTKTISIKVSAKMHKEINELMDDKDWKLPAFVRVAIQESIDKVKADGSN